MTSSIKTVTSHELDAIMQNDIAAQIVDVRSTEEHANTHIRGAIHIPLQQLSGHIINKTLGHAAGRLNGLYLVCSSGARSEIAYRRLESMGYDNMYMLDGGMSAWTSSKLPVVTRHYLPSLEQQAYVLAGIVFVILLLKGLALSPWFFALAALVGVGLILPSLNTENSLAAVICRLPWNRDMQFCMAKSPLADIHTPGDRSSK